MLGLYLLFWLQLNLAQTIPLALALGLFTAGDREGGLVERETERQREV